MTLLKTTPTSPKPSQRIPPLQNGDRLTRPEFERRFDATPDLKNAELLEGTVYMSPPVSQTNHGGPHFNLVTWLGHYRAATPGILAGDNSSLRLDLDNMPQPDAFLLIEPSHGGQARISEDGYVEGAPEFVAEVAASSVSYDLHVKKNVYRRNGVREYLVWRVLDRAIDWFILENGEYALLAPGPDGITRSRTFPGLWLRADALLDGNLAELLDVQRQGINHPAHAQFISPPPR